MAVTALTIIVTRSLFSVIVLSSVYSFLMATVLVALDAVDVAMTEASVGAGISTVLLLGALHLCKSKEVKPARKLWLPLAVSVSTGALLVYGALGLPDFGDPAAPIHQNVVPRYLKNEVEVPNVVTAVLASFRGTRSAKPRWCLPQALASSPCFGVPENIRPRRRSTSHER